MQGVENIKKWFYNKFILPLRQAVAIQRLNKRARRISGDFELHDHVTGVSIKYRMITDPKEIEEIAAYCQKNNKTIKGEE